MSSRTSGSISTASSLRLAAVKLAATPTCHSCPSGAYKPEDQRTDTVTGFVHAISGDDAVCAPDVFELELDPLVEHVSVTERLDDQPVQPGTLGGVEPLHCQLRVTGGRGEMHRRSESGRDALESGPTLAEGSVDIRLVAEGEQIERDEPGRSLLCQHFTRDSAGWMRWPRASKSSRPSTLTISSPSTTQRSGRTSP